MKIVNLTPHPLTIEGIGAIEPSAAGPARVHVEYETCDHGGGLRAATAVYGDLEGLPEPKAGLIYAVSGYVLARCEGRRDVVAPDTGFDSAIRDDQGRIQGVRRVLRAPGVQPHEPFEQQ